MSGLITISVPTHRRPSFLLHTLHSCFIQDYRPLEIDVSDDSPGDDSELLVKSLALPDGISLRYWRNRPSLGQAGSVNRLFAEARGSRLVLLHDDDLLLPGAVTAMDAAWDRIPDVLAVYGRQQILFDSGEVDHVETDLKAAFYKRDREHIGEQRKLMLSALWRQFPNNGYLIETAIAREAGYRSFDLVGHACDFDFGINLALKGRGRAFLMIDQTTSQYRYNYTSLSRLPDVTWRIYDYVLGLRDLSSEEIIARDALLRQIAAQATKENALNGRRGAALRIWCSRFYPRKAIVKSIFHLGLILTPRFNTVRRLRQVAPTFPLVTSENGARRVGG